MYKQDQNGFYLIDSLNVIEFKKKIFLTNAWIMSFQQVVEC